MYNEILLALFETALMVFASGFLAVLIGLPLGIVLFGTAPNKLFANAVVYRLLGFIVNIGRSIPFIILFIALMPFTKFLVHKTIGVQAAIVVLTVAAIPFFARLVEMALQEVSSGLIEAALSMGASARQIVWHVLLPEAYPALVSGATVMLINLVGYSAMTGFTGTGGLGAMAINYGYNRYDTGVIAITVVLMVLLVQTIQILGDYAQKYRNPA